MSCHEVGVATLFFLPSDRVEAQHREIGVHAGPGVGRRAVAEYGLQRRSALRLVGFQQARLLEGDQAGDGKPEHDIGARIVLLGEEARRDDAGGVAHPHDLHVRNGRLDRLLERTELVVLDRRIDGNLGALRGGRCHSEHRGKADGAQKSQTSFDHLLFSFPSKR